MNPPRLGLDNEPPILQLQRAPRVVPRNIPMMRVSELKQLLSAALSRTNTPLTFNEKRGLRAALNNMSDKHVDDNYPIPSILSQVGAIPADANRGIIGNGGSRKRKSLRKKRKSLRKKRMSLHKKRK